jgi:hypothetical protein
VDHADLRVANELENVTLDIGQREVGDRPFETDPPAGIKIRIEAGSLREPVLVFYEVIHKKYAESFDTRQNGLEKAVAIAGELSGFFHTSVASLTESQDVG